MEQESTTNHQSADGKIYKDKEIWVGALLGGVLAAGYMIAHNYKTFGAADKARKTWLVTVAALVFLLYISFFAPYFDRVPGTFFSLVLAGITVVLVQMYQGENIKAHVSAGGRIHSWWTTLGVSLVGAVVSVLLFLGAGFVIDSIANANITTKTYGTMRNEINFDQSNITESEVDALAGALDKKGFFDDQGKWYLFARKDGDVYEITVSVTRAAVTDKEHLEFFSRLREEVQAQFPNNKIVINLAVENLRTVAKRIE